MVLLFLTFFLPDLKTTGVEPDTELTVTSSANLASELDPATETTAHTHSTVSINRYEYGHV